MDKSTYPVNCIRINKSLNPDVFNSIISKYHIKYSRTSRTAQLLDTELKAYDLGSRIPLPGVEDIVNACLYLCLAYFYRIVYQNFTLDHQNSALYLIKKLHPVKNTTCVTGEDSIIEEFVKFTQRNNSLGIGISVIVFHRQTGAIEIFYDGTFDPWRTITIEYDSYGVGHYVPMTIVPDNVTSTPTIDIDDFYNAY